MISVSRGNLLTLKFCLNKVNKIYLIITNIFYFVIYIYVELRRLPLHAIFFIFFVEVFNIKPNFLVNEEIKFSQVQVIDENGEKLGKMPTNQAVQMAYEKGKDLVLVSPNQENPVCKILDYSKYKFEMAKRAKEARKKQKTIEIKEIRLSPNIDKHDLEVKAKNANKFIEAGNKVKIAMRFRGRELNFINQGKEIMIQFKDMLDNCQIDKEAKMEGKNLTMFLSPKQK